MRALLILFTLLAMPALACQTHANEQIIKADIAHPDAVCGDLMYFDFGSGGHGPAYYTDKQGNILTECGGGLRQAVPGEKPVQCPPQSWTCEEPPASGNDEHTPRVNSAKTSTK